MVTVSVEVPEAPAASDSVEGERLSDQLALSLFVRM